MRSVDQIMAAEERDMLFVQFGASPFDNDPDHPARRRHFDWFAAQGLRWEAAAPRGWLEGDPGIYCVHFDGLADPRVALYAAEFEDADGKSLEPDAYQMYVQEYGSWLAKRRERGGEDEEDPR
jgi:hypothetical protein